MQQQLFLDVSQAVDAGAFQERLLKFAAALDFGLVNAWLVTEHSAAPTSIQYVGNRSDAFVEASSDPCLIVRDPVLHRLHRESLPFTYNLETYTESGNGDMADLLDAHGYRSGVTVALHLPGNKHFVLGLARDRDLPKTDEGITHLLANLQLVAVHAQIAAQRVLPAEPDIAGMPVTASDGRVMVAPSADPTDAVRLTQRETEVLRWTMAGKSGTMVAEILGVTHAAVKFHLGNAMRKLNTPTKHSAVLKAISLGLL